MLRASSPFSLEKLSRQDEVLIYRLNSVMKVVNAVVNE